MLMKCKARLFLTAAKDALVPEGHADAAFLYASPGDEIPDSAVALFGLVDGDLPAEGEKEKKPGGDKERRGGGDKGAGGSNAPAVLTSIKGIGEATAKNLVAAGIADVAALAAIDPAAPPTVQHLPPRFDWAAVVTLAKEALPPVAAAEPEAQA